MPTPRQSGNPIALKTKVSTRTAVLVAVAALALFGAVAWAISYSLLTPPCSYVKLESMPSSEVTSTNISASAFANKPVLYVKISNQNSGQFSQCNNVSLQKLTLNVQPTFVDVLGNANFYSIPSIKMELLNPPSGYSQPTASAYCASTGCFTELAFNPTLDKIAIGQPRTYKIYADLTEGIKTKGLAIEKQLSVSAKPNTASGNFSLQYLDSKSLSYKNTQTAQGFIGALPKLLDPVKPQVYLSQPTPLVDKVDIAFSTTIPVVKSKMNYGTTSGSYSKTVSAPDAPSGLDHHKISLSGLQPNTTYYYKVEATAKDGAVGTSAEASFTTKEAVSVSNITVTKTANSATITFTTTDAASAKVEYGIISGNTPSYGSSKTSSYPQAGNFKSHQVVLSGLTPNTNYSFRVRATGLLYGGPEDVSAGQSFKTPAQ